MKKEHDWCTNWQNVILLGAWLLENTDLEYDAETGYANGLQHYYEKPWKWTDEYNSMIKQDER
jgi:hypothetical protein